jgi:tetratricopeptide (TPR) repeat protein
MNWFRRNKKEVNIIDLDLETREEVLAFAGKRAEVYEKKWEKLSNRKIPFSWNWSAFFLSFFWMSYRKMNVFLYTLLGIKAVLDVLSILLIKQLPSNTSTFSAYLFLALGSNKIYFDYAFKKVKKLKNIYPNREERLEIIRKIGGVSWGHAMVFVVLMFAYTFAISIFEEKVYFSYMEPKFSEAANLQNAGKLDEAMELYNEIENKSIRVPGIFYNRALIYSSKKEYDEALNQINIYLKLSPDDNSAKAVRENILNEKKSEKD